MALYNVADSVRATQWVMGDGSADPASQTAASVSCSVALILSALCLVGTQLSLMFGWTLMLDRLSFIHMVSGFWGGLLTTCYLLDGWRWQSVWWLFGLFALPPALCEFATIVVLFRSSSYERH